MGYMPRTRAARKYSETVVQKYVDAGIAFGDAVAVIYMTEENRFIELFEAWENAEADYAKAGFQPVPLHNFIRVGYGQELEGIGERGEPILYAKDYRENNLGPVSPRC